MDKEKKEPKRKAKKGEKQKKGEQREIQTVRVLLGRINEVIPRSENVADKAIAWGILHDLRVKLTKDLAERAVEVQGKLLQSMEEDGIGASTGHAAQAIMIIWSKLKLKREPDQLITDDKQRKQVFLDARKDLGLESEAEGTEAEQLLEHEDQAD